MLQPLSGSLHRPLLRSSNGLDRPVPDTRTAMAQSRSFGSTGPFLWNAWSPYTRSQVLVSNPSSSITFFRTYITSLRPPCTLKVPLNAG